MVLFIVLGVIAIIQTGCMYLGIVAMYYGALCIIVMLVTFTKFDKITNFGKCVFTRYSFYILQ